MKENANKLTSAARRYSKYALILAIIMIYILPLGSYPLLEPDEGRYSEIPREMIESDNYVTPSLNYVKYFEKPAMLYWMNAASFKLLGETEFAARLATALCALLCAFVAARLGTFMFGRRAGFLAGIVAALSLLHFAIGTINITDMPLSFFLTLSMAAFYVAHIGGNRKWYLLFYASMAFGLLTKGLIAIVLPGGIIFWYIIFTRKWRLFLETLYIPGILLFFAIAVPWFYLVCKANPDFFYLFFIQEHFLRYATKMHSRYEPFWFFLPVIPAGLLPWTGFLPALFSKKSVVRSPENAAAKDANIFLLTWFAVILLFFSTSSSKLIPYVAPCMPPLAILIGADIIRMSRQGEWHGHALRWTLGVAVIFSSALVGYAFVTDYVTKGEAFLIASKISIGLLLGPVFAIWSTGRRRKDFTNSIVIFCVSALFFISGVQDIYPILGKTRSSYAEADVIIKEKGPDDVIAVYGEVLQGIPFYTKQRVMLVDYKGELNFGANHIEGKGWFPTSGDFLEQWNGGEKAFALVIDKDRIKNLFPDGVTGAERTFETEEYFILFNREADK